MSISRLMQMGAAYYAANADPWNNPDIANLSYDSVSFDLNISANSRGMLFKSDGTKLYISHDLPLSSDGIKEYTMSTAWDISTLSLSHTLDVSSTTTSSQGIYIKPDGSSLYITSGNDDTIYRYNLSTDWDLSTATSASQSFYVSSNEPSPTDVTFKPDGTRMYVCGTGSEAVSEYSLSTAWDVSTASYQNQFSTTTQSAYPSCVSFNDDGTKMYITTYSSSADIFEYDLSTAWDISTASYNSVSFGDSTLSSPWIHAFKSDGSKAYFIDDTDVVYQYST